MKKHALLIGLLFTIYSVNGQNFQQYYTQAREAYKGGDNAKFYELIVRASDLHPYHQGVMYYRGVAAALTGHSDEAIHYLHEAILINATFDLSIQELNVLSLQPGFVKLKEEQQELLKPIVHSTTAFTVSDRTLHPESIASGEKENEYYLSSVHKRKILKVKNGKVSDFTTSAQDGITSLLGIKVDKNKKVLWACSSPMEEMENFDTVSRSAVFKYDLKSGKLLNKFTPDASVKNSIFGDLILNKKGEAFISDTQSNTVFKVNESVKKLEAYYTSDQFWNIQGITFSEDERYLFIADYIKGLFRLDTQTKELIQVTREPNVSLKSIDGLIWYQHSLIAIQNGITPMRVTRYFLNDKLDAITRYEIIDRGLESFNEPTNGCVLNDTLYYIANSQWSGYDEKHQLKPVDQLQDVIILKTNLKEIR